jgi:uncharacterized protein (TIGR02118 family)
MPDNDLQGEPHDQDQRDVSVHRRRALRPRLLPRPAHADGEGQAGSACAYYTVEKGLAGRPPGAPPTFVAMCAFICDSAEGYQAAMEEHGAEIRGDIANYTDIAPVLQVSEVVVERSDR